MNRRNFVLAASASLLTGFGSVARAAKAARGLLLIDRLGPTTSTLYVARADGANERPLLASPGFDYHASFTPDGQSLVFTSERRGRGQSDLYTARLDGSGLRPLVSSPAVEDAAAVSPDGKRLVFVSTRDDHRANIWTVDLNTGAAARLTGVGQTAGLPGRQNGFFRPSWSPDGKWIVFSSDRESDWSGHACSAAQATSCSGPGVGWEHVQQLSLYVMRADGSGELRRVATREGFSAGSPRWSADGRRIIFYELSILDTWNARIPHLAVNAVSQIVSVDVASGERIAHSSGPGLKLFPQFLPDGAVAYQIRAGGEQGLYVAGKFRMKGSIRSPAWSPDGTLVVYEKTSETMLPQNTPYYSWEPGYDSGSTQAFPQLSSQGRLVVTDQANGSAIVSMQPDGSDRRVVFDPSHKGLAFQPCWSPDGQWIYFGFGLFFEARGKRPAQIMRIKADGTGLEALTNGPENCGFPSCSPDGREIVFRQWTEHGPGGLRILDIATRKVRLLTDQYDNLPGWSPDGHRIVFTRRLSDGNFDIFTIRPDGSQLARLTTSGANDAHGVWAIDGQILWTSGFYGFKDEAALYENNFQPYGQIWIMNADGSGKRTLTDSIWEDGEPMIVPARMMKHG